MIILSEMETMVMDYTKLWKLLVDKTKEKGLGKKCKSEFVNYL